MANNLTVLYTHGEDYAASYIEGDVGVKKAYRTAKANGGKATFRYEFGYAEVEIREFGEVDPAFISFVDNFTDYDATKHHYFFVITDEMKGDE